MLYYNNYYFIDYSKTYINVYSDNVDFNKFMKEQETNDIPDTANNIPLDGTGIYGELTSDNADCYSFWGKAGYNYYINLDWVSGDNCDFIVNYYSHEYYSEGGYYYWDNFTAVDSNQIKLGEYDNLRLSGSGSSKIVLHIKDVNKTEDSYLSSVIEEIASN